LIDFASFKLFNRLMRKSKVLAKIRAGKVARIVYLGTYLPYFPTHAGTCGFDGVWVDGEHRAWDQREAQALIAFHRLADVDCIWRPPTLDKTTLYRLLEDGASGIMIPHVSTPEKAKAVVESTKFPPIGDRGLDGVGLEAGYWPGDRQQFTQQANAETCIVVQIETPLAIENMEAIASIPGVDVLFLGPVDLGLRFGCGSEVSDTKMMEFQKNLARIAARHGKAWGRPVSNAAEAGQIREMGGQFIAMGGDFTAIQTHLLACGKEFDAALGEKSLGSKEVQSVSI
jgi:4-hydroxy-2-oxoheptanedioate aldolase